MSKDMADSSLKNEARFQLRNILNAAARCGHKRAAERVLEVFNTKLDEEHPLDFCDKEVC